MLTKHRLHAHVLILAVLSALFLAWRANASAQLRPALCYYETYYNRGSSESRPVEVDVTRKRSSGKLYYQYNTARWQPQGLLVAAPLDVGFRVMRFNPHAGNFSAPLEPGKAFKAPKPYDMSRETANPSLAWSPDGQSLLVEAMPLVGLETVHLSSGKRRLIIPQARLGSNEAGNVLGCDWSSDKKTIAYGVVGIDPAPKWRYDPEVPYLPDPGLHCDVWLTTLTNQQPKRLGHGSRPRFSPDGRWLVALDRLSDRPEMGVRLYDLHQSPPTHRMLVENVRAVSFTHRKDELAIVRPNGDLVLADLQGHVRPFMKAAEVLGRSFILQNDVKYPLGEVKRADIDWPRQ